MAIKQFFVGLALVVSYFTHAQTDLSVSPRVVGGDDAAENYPWMAQVFVGHSRCGGVQIADNWVLTAAHCTYQTDSEDKYIDPSQVSVVLGVQQRVTSSHSRAISVSEIYQHPLYVSPSSFGAAYDYDVSLLRLASAQPISAPVLNANQVKDAVNIGGLMSLLGFGRINTDPLNSVYPEVLQQGALRLYDAEKCAEAWPSSTVTERMFCAYGTNQDACSGDSGGPVIINEPNGVRLLGLVSWGSIACKNKPGVYTDIGKVCLWITDTASLAGDSRLECTQAEPRASGGGASFWLILIGLPLLLLRRKLSNVHLRR
ncbi:S1 family serine peptidase [Agarivorans sp. MS3-6]